MTTEEFENLLSVYGDDIYRFCFHLMRSRENADDLYQDTVLTAFRKADFINISENPKAYLLSVAVKLSHNFFRKEKRLNLGVGFKKSRGYRFKITARSDFTNRARRKSYPTLS